jgi:hypothetical protein
MAKLKIGWSAVAPRMGGREPVPGADIPQGPRHAVPVTGDLALCGARVVLRDQDRDWPAAEMAGVLCVACRDEASNSPQR